MKYLILFVAYAPWVAVYLGMAYLCLKEGLIQESPRGMHPVCSAMGLTCCAMWLLVAPFLLYFMALLLGLFGSLGATICSVSIYLADRCKRMRHPLPLQISLVLVGSAAVLVGLMLAMPHPPIKLDLPPDWQRLQCPTCGIWF
jgi:hypothetical protein